MNEKFKELRKKAEDSVRQEHGYPTNALLPEEWVDSKFAELIVQDINNTILHTARWHQEVDKDDNTVMALCDLVKDIREEYGVEG
jgi:hypothetical protein